MDQIVNLAMFTMDRTLTQSPQRCSEFLVREIKPRFDRSAPPARDSIVAGRMHGAEPSRPDERQTTAARRRRRLYGDWRGLDSGKIPGAGNGVAIVIDDAGSHRGQRAAAADRDGQTRTHYKSCSSRCRSLQFRRLT